MSVFVAMSESQGAHEAGLTVLPRREKRTGEKHDLFLCAALALLEEDRRLYAALGVREFYSNKARGLAYWVFEHNLVYALFRAWAPWYDVVWDELLPTGEPAAKSQTRLNQDAAAAVEPPRSHSGQAMREFIDLRVNWSRSESTLLFEAKWWNRTSDALSADLERLGRRSAMGYECYQLVFWYGSEATRRADFAAAEGQLEALRSSSGLNLTSLFAATFPTQLANGQGYFAMGVISVSKAE